jgi:hypothetical protein
LHKGSTKSQIPRPLKKDPVAHLKQREPVLSHSAQSGFVLFLSVDLTQSLSEERE